MRNQDEEMSLFLVAILVLKFILKLRFPTTTPSNCLKKMCFEEHHTAYAKNFLPIAVGEGGDDVPGVVSTLRACLAAVHRLDNQLVAN